MATLETENTRLNTEMLKNQHRYNEESYNQGYEHRRNEENFRINAQLENKRELEAITMELRMQGCTANIRPFGGESSERFQMWLGDMQRALTQLGDDDARARTLVLQTLTGPAADYATREIRRNPGITWTALKTKLDERYSDLADAQFARQRLRRMVQAKTENVQNYFERIMTAATAAYGETKLQDEYVQEELIQVFIDGMTQDNTVKRLIRLNLKNMDDALKAATQEQQAQKAFSLRRGYVTEHEPMEVDEVQRHVTNTQGDKEKDLRQGMEEIKSILIRQMAGNPMDVQEVATPQQYIPRELRPNPPSTSMSYPPPPLYQNTRPAALNPGVKPRRTIICYQCNRPGHIRRECRSNQEASSRHFLPSYGPYTQPQYYNRPASDTNRRVTPAPFPRKYSEHQQVPTWQDRNHFNYQGPYNEQARFPKNA